KGQRAGVGDKGVERVEFGGGAREGDGGGGGDGRNVVAGGVLGNHRRPVVDVPGTGGGGEGIGRAGEVAGSEADFDGTGVPGFDGAGDFVVGVEGDRVPGRLGRDGPGHGVAVDNAAMGAGTDGDARGNDEGVNASGEGLARGEAGAVEGDVAS